eukprot:CAMPEP_0182459742 /NCGR_PEP_ID=MMETSP1319-20130603/4797_1 /TAXON_ID=172717 /ORGANISM="Bolidomonas pacifica, Strain RCC208" /LENGTH=103 /DNA_ID=CAMNT_0024658721 /DNA_START=132 /DNA_END=438 /DNA_ORIENTATION=+
MDDLDSLLDSVSLESLGPPPPSSSQHPGVPHFRSLLMKVLSKMDSLPKDCMKEGDVVVSGLGARYGGGGAARRDQDTGGDGRKEGAGDGEAMRVKGAAGPAFS